MMLRITSLLIVILFTGCTHVTSYTSKSFGDQWGVKNNHWVIRNTGWPCTTWFQSTCWSSEVFYCPPDGSTCVKAKMCTAENNYCDGSEAPEPAAAPAAEPATSTSSAGTSGEPHPEYPNVVVINGNLEPKAGYTWASNEPGDYSVVPISGGSESSVSSGSSSSGPPSGAIATERKGIFDLPSSTVRALRKLKGKAITVGLVSGGSVSGTLRKVTGKGLLVVAGGGETNYAWNKVTWFK
ncbi:MAG: hypothetical protein VX223_10715 [Myxococcota bacterium]|nr:hypothetical protein [Myxococcota bacterium]